MTIKIYVKRGNETKLAKIFKSKDNFKNQIKAVFYILDFKKYLKQNNLTDIYLLVNNEHLQNIANSI